MSDKEFPDRLFENDKNMSDIKVSDNFKNISDKEFSNRLLVGAAMFDFEVPVPWTAAVLKDRGLIKTAGHRAGSCADRHKRKGRTPIKNGPQTRHRALIRSPRAELKGQGPE